MANGVAITIDGEVDSELVNAAQIEVLEKWHEPVRYQLSYNVDISEGDLTMLVDERFNPGMEVGVFVTTMDNTHCLVKGPIYAHNIHLKHGGTGSGLVVSGADNSIKLARENKSVQWSDVTDSDIVTSILSSLSVILDVEATSAGHFSDKHSLVQRGTDLALVKKLARRNGYLFWISFDADGVETAHFKKPSLDESAELDLIINLDEANLDELTVSWDVERPDTVTAEQLDLNALTVLDGGSSESEQALLGTQNLASVRGNTFSTHISTAIDDAGDLQGRVQGVLAESNWFIKVVCAVSVLRVGDVVRSHTIVNLRGAGSRYSGHYFVAEVRHLINVSSHLMEITLVRNAW